MKSYLERQNECGIKVGDKVKVVRNAADYEDGWDNEWIPIMNAAVGNEYKVIANNGELGFTLDLDSSYDFPYFALSKVAEKPEPSPQSTDDDFTGYDTDYMDNWIKEAVERRQAELEAMRNPVQTPKPASGYTATLTFDLTTIDGAEAWQTHKQADELRSFAFEVLYNLSKNFERTLDVQAERIITENTTVADDVELAVDILRRLINELAENYNLNVN